MTLEEKKQEVIEEFSMYDEWLDRYEYLIELGKALEPYPEEEKTEEKLIKGCQSRVWLDYALEDGKLYFRADSDAIITKGIISLLISVYSGRTPAEIAGDDFGIRKCLPLRTLQPSSRSIRTSSSPSSRCTILRFRSISTTSDSSMS